MSVSIFDHVPIQNGHVEFAIGTSDKHVGNDIALDKSTSYIVIQADVDYFVKQGLIGSSDNGFRRFAHTDYMLSRSEWTNFHLKADASGTMSIQQYKA